MINPCLIKTLGICLHGTGSKWIGSKKLDWLSLLFRSYCSRMAQNRSKNRPAFYQVKCWIHSGLVPEWTSVNADQIQAFPCKQKPIWSGSVQNSSGLVLLCPEMHTTTKMANLTKCGKIGDLTKFCWKDLDLRQ